jgi:hypothetical protein
MNAALGTFSNAPDELADITADELLKTAARVMREFTKDVIKAPEVLPPLTFKPLTFKETGVYVRNLAPMPAVRDVVRKLGSLSIDMKQLTVDHSLRGHSIQPGMMVKLLRRENPYTPNEIHLSGSIASIASTATDAEVVDAARKLMIELVTHEIDEALYVAGLGPDPHAPKFEVTLQLQTIEREDKEHEL